MSMYPAYTHTSFHHVEEVKVRINKSTDGHYHWIQLDLLQEGKEVGSLVFYVDEGEGDLERLARSFSIKASTCSICRGFHGEETVHASE